MIRTWRKTSSESIYSPNVIKDIHMKTMEGYNVKIFTDNIEDTALDQIRQLLSIDVFSDSLQLIDRHNLFCDLL